MIRLLRWLLFIILSIGAIGLFDWLLEIAILNIAKLAWYWITLIIIFGGGLIYGLLVSLFAPAVIWALSISPRPNIGKWIVFIFVLSALIWDCIRYVQYDFSTFGFVVLYVTFVSLWLTIGISIVSLDTDDE